MDLRRNNERGSVLLIALLVILSLAALGVGPGDEVLTSPFSFFSSASCAYRVGARPAFAAVATGNDQRKTRGPGTAQKRINRPGAKVLEA